MSAVLTPAKSRLPVVIGDDFRIPDSVVDLESFRRWARSDGFPEQGRISYLDDEIWVDLSLERLFSHNLRKTEYTVVVGGFVKTDRLGYFFSDRVLLSHTEANLSEPDATFLCWETLKSERASLVKGKHKDFVEIEGSPDMVLEIVSPTSVKKDTEKLLELYWRADIAEYWLVDARGSSLRFDIFKHGAKGYVPTRPQRGKLKSGVFSRSFELSQQTDPLGNPQFILTVV